MKELFCFVCKYNGFLFAVQKREWYFFERIFVALLKNSEFCVVTTALVLLAYL